MKRDSYAHVSRFCSIGKVVAAAGLVAALGALAPSVAVADDAPAVEQATTAEIASTAAAQDVADTASAAEDEPATAEAADEAEPATTTAPAATTSADEPGVQPQAAPVAKIGDAAYATLDDAIAAAKDGDAVDLAQDATIAETNFITKRIFVRGNGHAVDVTRQPGTDGGDLTIKGSGALTFENADVNFTGSAKWAVTMRDQGQISFVNGSNASFTEAGIYTVGSGCAINVDASTVKFSGTSYTSLMNEGDLAAINVTNGANLTIERAGRGTGEEINGATSFAISVVNSELHVDNNDNQGLVFCKLTLDNSKATISGNAWGMYGGNGLCALELKNASTLEMIGNKDAGILLGRGSVDIADGTTLTISGTGADGVKQGWSAGAISAYSRSAKVTIADGATVNLVNNPVGAINNGGEMYVGANTTITGNGSNAGNGGGILNTGKVTIADGARLYNNHAKVSGDDIRNTSAKQGAACGTITFVDTGSDWQLDDVLGNCSHAIDGWYEDAADARWSAHGDQKHVSAVTSGTFDSELSLKAAHGLVRVDYKYVGDAPDAAQLPDSDENLEAGAAYTSKPQTGVDGWTFDGWYVDEACTQRWNDGDELAGSMTLYGKWNELPEQSSGDDTPAKPSSSTPIKGAEKALPQTGDNAAGSVAALAASGAVAMAAGLAARKRAK